MDDIEQKSDLIIQRLCTEIQLFDLCNLESCNHKNGRFCTDPTMLGRFEKISEDEVCAPERYIYEETDDSDAEEGESGLEYSEDDEDFCGEEDG